MRTAPRSPAWPTRLARLLNVVMAVYVVGYVAFRQTHMEVWPKDGQRYVIYPESGGLALSYLWRPLAYLDFRVTGTRTHIGPHPA